MPSHTKIPSKFSKREDDPLRQSKGFTLIELLIAIAIASVLIGITVLTLRTSWDTYHFVQDDLFLQKVLDDTLQTIAEGDYESYGIRDSLEILQASAQSIVFVPPWVDDSHIVAGSKDRKEKEYILNRSFKAGASLPIGEILTKRKNVLQWQQYPITFKLNEQTDQGSLKDRVLFNVPVPYGAKVRYIYHPDTLNFSDAAMVIKNNKEDILRIYKNKSDVIPKHNEFNVKLTQLHFQYFDNTNTEIVPDPYTGKILKEQLAAITAVRLNLQVRLADQKKSGSMFVNIRNTRTAGSGLLIREGTTITIPNSHDIRTFSLVNIIGVKQGGMIKLEALSDSGRSWRIGVELGIEDDKEQIKRYSVEYPAGQKVFSENVNITTDLPLNFLTLGGNGKFDYDFDVDVNNTVILDGIVQLKVLQLDAAGAALYVRP